MKVDVMIIVCKDFYLGGLYGFEIEFIIYRI